MWDAAGRFLFRWRNALFPLVFAGLLFALPPRPDAGWGTWAGLLLVAAGQVLRLVTIGLDYVKRGGRHGQFFAYGLVTGGIFAHCRNPMYTGNLAIVVGFLLIAGDPVALAVGTLFFGAAYLVIVAGEERYLAQRFGDGYRAYRARVPRWLPRLRGLAQTLRSHRLDGRRIIAKEYGTLYTSLTVPAGLLAWKAIRAGGGGVEVALLAPYGGFAAIVLIAYLAVRFLKRSGRLKKPSPPVLDELRAHIDALDGELLRLLNERAALVSRIFAHKHSAGLGRYDAVRAREIIDRARRLNPGPLGDDEVERIFSCLLECFAPSLGAEPEGEETAQAAPETHGRVDA